jgi:signal transduction histidine kinase
MVVIVFAKLQFTTSIYGHILPFILPLFLIINLLYVKNLQSNYIDKIKLQFENTELVSLLKEQQLELINKNELAQKSKEIAIDANKRKSQFIAAASHDLSQPLYSMGLFLSAMKDEKNVQRQKEYIAKSNECVESMSNLYSSLMDISKFDSENMNAEIKTVNILNILDPISTEFELPIKSKDLEFTCNIESAMVNTDAILLQRIVRNLLNNALLYTNTGQIGLVTKAVANNKLKIEIFDTGIGIPEKELDNIFDEFYQLQNPHRDNKKGRGLGLSIVKRMVDLLGLELKISSTVGEGSCFSLKVPYA